MTLEHEIKSDIELRFPASSGWS